MCGDEGRTRREMRGLRSDVATTGVKTSLPSTHLSTEPNPKVEDEKEKEKIPKKLTNKHTRPRKCPRSAASPSSPSPPQRACVSRRERVQVVSRAWVGFVGARAEVEVGVEEEEGGGRAGVGVGGEVVFHCGWVVSRGMLWEGWA